MKALMRNPRTAAPTFAVFVALVLTFAVPPFNSVVAAGSSASMSSSSPAPDCDSHFRVRDGQVSPPSTVSGTLFLDPPCDQGFVGEVKVALNDASLRKSPATNGTVNVSVKIETLTKGVLDDPVDVTLHQGLNTVVVTGPTQFGTTGTITADFELVPGPATPTTPVTVTPVAQTQTTTTPSGSLAHTGMNLLAMMLLALMAIALGAYALASERAMPVAVAAGPEAVAVTVPLWDPTLGGRVESTLESVALAAVALVLGPPSGRHISKDRSGLLPMLRDRMGR